VKNCEKQDLIINLLKITEPANKHKNATKSMITDSKTFPSAARSARAAAGA